VWRSCTRMTSSLDRAPSASTPVRCEPLLDALHVVVAIDAEQQAAIPAEFPAELLCSDLDSGGPL